MQPPEWCRKAGARLNLEEFGAEFARAWSLMTWRFLKLECWQSYQELDTNKSLEAYNAGDFDRARDLLEGEAEADRPLYDGVRNRGIQYARIRLVQLPLTPYLAYEMINYRIRREMGEAIEVVEMPATVTLPNERYFDFLLFDVESALIHDYGDDGRQVGGWITGQSEVLRALEATAVSLRREASGLADFLAKASS